MDTTLTAKPLTDTEITDIKGRHEAATGGLWTLDPDGAFGPGTVVTETGGYSSMIGAIDFGHGEEADADTRFVLNAHSDMGALLAEIGRLQARVAELIPSVCTCERFAGHHAPTCHTITG